jgi:hypothetical protein
MDKSSKLAEFAKLMLKHSPANIPHPFPLIEKKAKERLSTNGLISFYVLMKEWKNIDLEDKRIISKLLVLNSFNVVETLELTRTLSEEVSDTADFVSENPEYRNECFGSPLDEISKLFDDDE